MTYRLLPKTGMETDYDDGVRYFRVWCFACKDMDRFDSMAEAEDWQNEHVCISDEEDGDDE